MTKFDQLISCEQCKAEDTENHFGQNDKFVMHLKYVHKLKLSDYKKKFPGARTEVVVPAVMDKEELAEKLFETEKIVDPLKAEAAQFPKAFDPSEIDDPDYIMAALEKAWPEKKIYIEEFKDELYKSGFPKSKMLDQLSLYSLFIRDMQLRTMSQTPADGLFFVTTEEVESFKKISETIKKILDTMKDMYEKTRDETQVHNLIEQLMGEADTHIRQNLGELDFKCDNCGAMIDSSGYAHWAYEIRQEASGKNLYIMWSDKLWEMVKGFTTRDTFGNETHHRILIWQMAYTLDTSVEGLLLTAKHRGMDTDKFVENGRKMASIDGYKFDLAIEEEQSKLANEHYERVYHPKSLRKIGQ